MAIAQEEKTLGDLGKINKRFKPTPKFPVLADIGYTQTKGYDRVSMYLIDKQGRVAQVFDSLIHFRPPWNAVLAELRALHARQEQTAAADSNSP